MQYGGVGDADDRAFGRLEPSDGLAPGLLASRVHQLVAGPLELARGGLHRGGVAFVSCAGRCATPVLGCEVGKRLGEGPVVAGEVSG